MKKYQNLYDNNLFGNYEDPFIERREKGPTKPAKKPIVEKYRILEKKCDLSYVWFGHSSVMIEMEGKRILVDPVFSKFASPVQFAGPVRFIGKTISVEELPDIDIVLITHCHYDHLDYATIRKLKNKSKHFVVPTGVGKIISRMGVSKQKIEELEWYESYMYENFKITACPTQHGSDRYLFNANKTLWCSYYINNGTYTVFHSGDGGYNRHFKEIYEKYGSVDLAFMECGQYNKHWHGYHMFPEESVQAALDLHAKTAVPIHFGAYNLSDHYYLEPVNRFRRRSEEMKLNAEFPEINVNYQPNFRETKA